MMRQGIRFMVRITMVAERRKEGYSKGIGSVWETDGTDLSVVF